MNYLTPSNWKQLGFFLGIAAFFVVNVGLSALGIAEGQILPGLIAGIAVFMYCNYVSSSKMDLLSAPEVKIYALPKHQVIKIFTDTVPNLNLNMPQVHWISQWKNDQKGEMKFRVPYELPGAATPGKQQGMEKQEIILNVYLTTLEGNAKTGVKLIFETPKMHFKQIEMANNIITATAECIDYQLKREESQKVNPKL